MVTKKGNSVPLKKLIDLLLRPKRLNGKGNAITLDFTPQISRYKPTRSLSIYPFISVMGASQLG